MPELPEVEALRRALDDPVRAFSIERAGPAHVATLKTFDPPLAALEGRRLAGAERRGKRLLFPTDDGELVLQVHLMAAGRLRHLAAGEKGPKSPALRLRFAGGSELVLTETGSHKRAGVWLLSPEAAEAELAHLGPEALGLGADRLGELTPRCATNASWRGSGGRGRTRSSTGPGSRPSRSRRSSPTRRSRAWPPRSTRSSSEESRYASEGPPTGAPIASTSGSASPARNAERRSPASTTRSTRSITARPARRAAACSRTGGSRGCFVRPLRGGCPPPRRGAPRPRRAAPGACRRPDGPPRRSVRAPSAPAARPRARGRR